MFLLESRVVQYIKIYLASKGWIVTNNQKTIEEHGVDIRARHKRWNKIYLIETKGENRNFQTQVKHSAFYNLLGQILCRMDKEGNAANRARFYAIGIPKKWENTFKKKIIKMKYGWKLLKLKVFLVHHNGEVEKNLTRTF